MLNCELRTLKKIFFGLWNFLWNFLWALYLCHSKKNFFVLTEILCTDINTGVKNDVIVKKNFFVLTEILCTDINTGVK